MDRATRLRYDTWKKKKILKYIIAIVGLLILVGILILGLRWFGSGDSLEDEDEYLTTAATVPTETQAEIDETTPEENPRTHLSVMQDELEMRLNEMVNQTPGIIGLSYYCLTTGRQISINANEIFFSASTIKLPTHMMIAEAVHAGTLSWDQILIVEENHWHSGSGVLKYRIEFGHELTLYEALRYSIVYSDNIAHRMLTSTLIPNFQHGSGLDNNYYELTAKVLNRYVNGVMPTGRMLITPNQLLEIFKVLDRDQYRIEGYGMILDHMTNSVWSDRFITSSTDGYVAHTPGWTYPYSHDSGIFFADYPYILIVMTQGLYFSAPDFLSEISELVFQLHNDLQ